MAEPEWDEETRALARAYDSVDLCPRCGGPAFLCQDPAREYDWEAPAPIRCHASTAILRRQKGVTEESNPQADALIWRVRLTGGSA